MVENVNLSIKRDALIGQLYSVDNVDVIEKVQRALNKAMAAVKQATAKKTVEDDDVEYISKEELMADLREAFTEMYQDQRDGIKRKTLQEVIDEL